MPPYYSQFNNDNTSNRSIQCREQKKEECIGSRYQQQFPILALVARRVLAVPATSASTERLFSAGGRVCTFDRARMKPRNVDILTTLHVWERSALEEDRRTLQRLAANEKFCCLKVDDLFSVILIPGGLDDYDDDEEFVDDE